SSIAKYMKQRSFDYNKEYPSNEVVIADLNRLSGGSLSVEPDTLDNTQIIRPVKKQSEQNNQNRFHRRKA
ncbi:MAG: hypothetical protein RSC07_00935, partial [Mucinivorans sp.]